VEEKRTPQAWIGRDVLPVQKGCRKLRVRDPPRGERAGLRLHSQSERGDGADLRSLERGKLGSALRTGGLSKFRDGGRAGEPGEPDTASRTGGPGKLIDEGRPRQD